MTPVPKPRPGRPPASEDDAVPPKLSGGRLLSAISTAIVGMLREFYGRGPMRAKTYAIDDIIVVVMRDSGYSAIERRPPTTGLTARVLLVSKPRSQRHADGRRVPQWTSTSSALLPDGLVLRSPARAYFRELVVHPVSSLGHASRTLPL